jgi:hypothetical protein
MGVYRNLFHEAGRHRRLQTLGPARRIYALIARNDRCKVVLAVNHSVVVLAAIK